MNPSIKTIQAIHTIFNARSVALVGASNDPTKLGYMTLDSIIRGGYEGRIYPVNPRGGEILGLTVYRSLIEIPDNTDLAVILVPARFVPGVLQEAVDKGIPGAVILSAGFREVGDVDLEDEIVSIARKGALRFVGPNVQGINYIPNKLCAMFFPVITKRGPLAIISQSGSATAALSEWADYDGIGISAAVNLGNQADLCESDYLDFFATDDNTTAIAMYIEGVEDGRRFFNTLGRVTGQKPVVMLKSGRSSAGRRAAQSHTGALAGSYEVFRSACRQSGAITADSIETLFDRAKGLACIRPPRGKRILSISTSGGMGALAADETEAESLTMPVLPQDLVQELARQEISPFANMLNPLDLGYVEAEAFRYAALLCDRFNMADVILLNLGDPVLGSVELAVELAETIQASFAVCYLGGGEEEKQARVKMHEAGIAVYPSPERAIRGIAAAVQAAEYRRKRRGLRFEKHFGIDRKPTLDGIQTRFVPEHETVQFLSQYDIPYPPHGVAKDPDNATAIAERIGYPVVLKIISPDVIHKTEVGGINIGLESAEQVRTAYGEIIDRVLAAAPNASIEGVLVCKQAEPGLEIIVGAVEDPFFGPTIMFGFGGIFAELFSDVSFRIAPLSQIDAEEMVKEIKGFPILAGFRGKPRYDIESLTAFLMSVSRLVAENDHIKELDFNPVRLYSRGFMVLDARMIKAET